MEIVKASIAARHDAGQLLAEYYEAVGVLERDTPESLRSYLSGADSALWLAYVGGAPAGCVVLRPLSLPDGERAGECKRLYVRPAFRGHGIAKTLLDVLETHAAEQGWRWVYLDSTGDMKAAHRLYRKRGYSACERYNSNPQAEVFLRKTL